MALLRRCAADKVRAVGHDVFAQRFEGGNQAAMLLGALVLVFPPHIRLRPVRAICSP